MATATPAQPTFSAPPFVGVAATPAPTAQPTFSARADGPAPPAAPGAASSVMVAGGESIALLAGESIVGEWYFTPRQILAHLKTHVVLTDQRVLVSDPNTIFGIIPVGYHRSSAPHGAVDQVDHGTRVLSMRVLFGVGLLLYLLFNIVVGSNDYGSFQIGLTQLILGLPLFGAAAYCFITARVVGIFLHAGGAHTIGARARGSELASVEAAAFQINQWVTQARRFGPSNH